MTLSTERPKTETPRPDDRPCWREIIGVAFDGLPHPDMRLEEMLDRIERHP